MKVYLFDIDGTLADLTHRLHHISGEYDNQGMEKPKNWDAFFAACSDDKPIKHVVELAKMIVDADKTIVYVSGRSDSVRGQTLMWLAGHVGSVGPLYMRKHGDHRPDNIVKSEILDQIILDGYEPVMVFEDRDQVVKMWRERGITCLQVAEGSF